jgi:broad-specificity NMP kinase
MKLPADVLLLGGAPGVGKSSAAKLLSRHCPKGVLIEVDLVRLMVISVDWGRQTEHRQMLRIAAEMARRFLSAGFGPVIVVDTFSGTKMDFFRKELARSCKGKRVDQVCLVAEPAVLRKRIEKRPKGGFKKTAVSLKINSDFLGGLAGRLRILDTTDMSPSMVADAIKDMHILPCSSA